MITTIRSEYSHFAPLWQRVRDVVAGEDQVKTKARTYLPSVLKGETEYRNYLSRSVFINYTGKILNLSLGQLFRNLPTVANLPDYIAADIDLRGTNLPNWSRFIARELMITNRVGLWVDYSDTTGRPYISTYKAEEIINWHYANTSDGIADLQYVILSGFDNIVEDYEIKQVKTYTVVYLNDEGQFTVDRYKENHAARNKEKLELISSVVPVCDGQPLDFIPFAILDLTGQPDSIHNAPLLDVANLNLAHYRDSADHQTRLHLFALPTVVTKGYNPQDKQAFPLCGVADVGQNGDAKLLELSAANPLAEELKRKEEAIAQIGSSFMSGSGRYVASAQTASINQEADFCTLSDISNSLSEQISKVLNVLAIWLTDQETADPISVKYNTVFEEPSLIQGQLTELVGAVSTGLISYDAFYHQLEKNKFYPAGWDSDREKVAIKQSQRDLIDNRSQIPGYTT